VRYPHHLTITVLFCGLLMSCSNPLGTKPNAGPNYHPGLLTPPTTSTPPTTNYPVYTVIVVAVYPNHGANWNDYVTVNNAALDAYSQNDTICTGAEHYYNTGCIHGAERRKVVMDPSFTSCTGLTITDSIGAFDWVCHVNASIVTFYSQGLKVNFGLRDLIDFTGLQWLTNSVSVSNGSRVVATSVPAKWWTNTILVAPDATAASQNLAAASTIYTLNANTTLYGYIMLADKISLVMPASVKLTLHAAPPTNCNYYGGAGGAIACIVATSNNFNWIEGSFDGANQTDQIVSLAGSFGVLRGAVVQGGFSFMNVDINGSSNYIVSTNSTNGKIGYYIQGAYHLFSNSTASNLSNEGFTNFASNAIFVDTQASNANSGLRLLGGPAVVVRYSGFNNSAGGLRLFSSSDSIVVGAIIANGGIGNSNIGYGSTGTTLQNLTSVNGDIGLFVFNTGDTLTMTNSAFVNNSSYGIIDTNDLLGGDGNNLIYFYGGAVISNSTGIRNTVTSNGETFNKYLLIGNNGTDCNIAGGQLGLVNNTCTDTGFNGSNTYSAVARATLYTGKSISSSFVGKVTSTDTSNGSNTNGTQAFGLITDWIGFLNKFRGWGVDGAAFPSASNNGSCAAGTCRIWDWTLSASDPLLTLINKGYNGSTANSAFVAGGPCPIEVNGNETVTDQASVPRTFLRNAIEIVYDPEHNFNGNNNGLCESNESCVYAPNIGAYQGQGTIDFTKTCTFTNGVVSNVKMYGYPVNGN
jgi:hypothetical protein